MTYESKCAEVTLCIVDTLKIALSDNEIVLDEWLSNGDAVVCLGEMYKEIFTDVFGSNIITPEIHDRLYLFGMNLVFALQTFKGRAADLDDLYLLGSTFIVQQMETLHIWCDELEVSFKQTTDDAYGEF